jgi:hypothetical protein
VPGINDVRQTDAHTSEPAVRNGSALEVTTTFENGERDKLLGDLEFREKLSTRKTKHDFLRILKLSLMFGTQIGCSL